MDDLNTKVITAFVNKYGNIEDIGEAELKDHIIKFSNTANDQLDTSKKSAYLYLVHVLQRSLQKYSVQQNDTISTIQPTSLDQSMLNVEGKNEIPEILLEQQVEQMPDQKDEELKALRAQVEQLKTEKQVVQQQPGEQLSKFAKVMRALNPAQWVQVGVDKLFSKK